MSRTCKVCNKVFPNGKSWGGHIRACYKNIEKEKEKYYWSSSESESEFQGHGHGDGDGDGVESSNKVSVQPINLMAHLPQGWSKNTKRRRDSTEQSSTDDDDILKMAAIKLLSLPSVITESKQKGIGGKLAKYQNKFAQHLSVNKNPMKINNAYTKEKRPADFVEGHKRTYVCRECGLVFDNFQGLGGHLAAHNRKRLREKVGESDLVEKGENVFNVTGSTAPARKEYKCNICGKSFPSGQALGGHKSYHSSAAYTGYSHSRKALVEHTITAPTELNHSGQALVGPKISNYSAANSIADMGYNHYASSRDETSSIVISHSNPPCAAEVSSPNPPLANVLDLNMPPDEGLWGF